MAIEVALKVAEVGTKAAEVSKKVTETGKKAIDVSKRIDVTKKIENNTPKGVDISKRIIPKEIAPVKEISKAISEYIKDLKEKSPCNETVSKDCLNPQKIEVKSTEEIKQLRKEFDSKKGQLIAEWEKINGQEWPKYKEDVLNERGEIIRKAGDRYDAHHIQPLQLGGKNEVGNITPLDQKNHKNIHSSEGSCKNLVNVVMGGIA